MDMPIEIPNYVGGRFKENREGARIVTTLDGQAALRVHDASFWTIEAAIETATSVQAELGRIPHEHIIHVLKRATDFFFENPNNYRLVSQLTGSPESFVSSSIEYTKAWCRNLSTLYARIFRQSEYLNNTRFAPEESFTNAENSAPLVAVIPSNSEQEVLYLIGQALLSRNAVIIRPSSKGASAYTCHEFVHALNKAVELEKDRQLETLIKAVNVVHIPTSVDYLKQLSVSGWNYIVFGSDSTVRTMESTIRQYCSPRRVLKFGTGLGTTVILDDADLDEAIGTIASSVTINRGDECDSTDIVYTHADHFENVLSDLTKALTNFRSGTKESGTILPENASFIFNELRHRGREEYCHIEYDEKGYFVFHSAVIPLHEFETTLEYPGPVVAVRPFRTLSELAELIDKDLNDNDMHRSLVTAVFTPSEERFREVLPYLRADAIKWNKPTHDIDLMNPHQGVYVLEELCCKSTVET